MKTATLTIEVSDDFKKGYCSLCKMRRYDNFGNMYCPLLGRKALPKTDKDCPLEIQDETEFTVNTEMFGKYCKIPTGFSKNMHIYKIVNMIESNAWMDVPITCKTEVVRHEAMEKVLNVIHCGVDETNVIRVALKDAEMIGE